MESPPPAQPGTPPASSDEATGAAQRYDLGPLIRSHILGETYQARDRSTGQTVALTLVWPDLVPSDGEEADRLHAAVARAKSLEHKSIAAVHGSGRQDDRLFVAYEHVAGDTLRGLIERKRETQRFYSPVGACNVALHVVAALDYAHAHVVHGGLTPSSILVTPEGRVKLLDFGLGPLASQARAHQVDGTKDAAYLPVAPEAGDIVHADLRSVGLLLHELITGEAPEGAYEPRPGIPAEIENVLRRCLTLEDQDRYGDARTLKDELLAIVTAAKGAQSGAQTMPPGARRATKPPPPPPTPASGTSRLLTPVVGLPRLPTPMMGIPRTPTPVAGVPRPPSPVAGVPRPRTPVTGVPRPATPMAGVPLLPQGPNTERSVRFAVDEAGPVDEGAERWLVHKDRLDFGPFSLSSVKEQIRKGKFGSENLIVDQSTGARLTIGAHPLLAPVLQEVTEERERRRREAADHAHRRADRRVRLLISAVVAGIVLIIVGGVLVVVKRQKPIVKEKIVYREKERNLEGLLKGIDIAWKAPPPPKKRRRRSSSSTPGAPAEVYDEFDAPLELGDASKGGGDEQLSQKTIETVMRKNFSKLTPCVLEEKRRDASLREVQIEFLVRGTGKVSAVRTNGQRSGPLADCMLDRMKRIEFPPFNGPRTRAGFSMSLR